jgi:hypothetical protein
MRPKVIATVLLVGIGVVTLVLFVNGLGQGNLEKVSPPVAIVARDRSISTGEKAAGQHSNGVGMVGNTTADATVPPRDPPPSEPSVIAMTFEQEHAARIEKDQDEMREALTSGNSDPATMNKVLDRLTHSDPEIRKEALSTAVNMGNQSAIPRLKEAMDQLEDPREKVAFMDAIDFLQLPTTIPFEDLTNFPPESLPNATTNRTLKVGLGRGRQPAAPPGPAK